MFNRITDRTRVRRNGRLIGTHEYQANLELLKSKI